MGFPFVEHDIAELLSLRGYSMRRCKMARYRVDGKASKWLVSYGVSLAEMSSILLR